LPFLLCFANSVCQFSLSNLILLVVAFQREDLHKMAVLCMFLWCLSLSLAAFEGVKAMLSSGQKPQMSGSKLFFRMLKSPFLRLKGGFLCLLE
jgi:hypothetical protein